MRSKLVGISEGDTLEIGVCAPTTGPAVLDVCCFGLDPDGVLSDDRYFLFYNQTTSPCGSFRIEPAIPPERQRFLMDIARLPTTIRRLCVTASIDGDGTMAQLGPSFLRVSTRGTEIARFPFSAADFSDEKSIILAEIYNHGGAWRLWAVGQGFAGGLDSLLAHYGGVAEAPPAGGQSTVAPPPDVPPLPVPVPLAAVSVAIPQPLPRSPAPSIPESIPDTISDTVIVTRQASILPGQVARGVDALPMRLDGPAQFRISVPHRSGSVRVRVNGESVAPSSVRAIPEVGGAGGVEYALAAERVNSAAVVRADYDPLD